MKAGLNLGHSDTGRELPKQHPTPAQKVISCWGSPSGPGEWGVDGTQGSEAAASPWLPGLAGLSPMTQ